jgi:hypothetical protein
MAPLLLIPGMTKTAGFGATGRPNNVTGFHMIG